MDEKKLTFLWGAGLICTGISSAVIFISLFADFGLRDLVIRAAGIADSAALAVLLFTTAKKMRKK
ncbi:MAG: hypothetical protein ACI4IW_03315 [Oscillospiraceae bacterium]